MKIHQNDDVIMRTYINGFEIDLTSYSDEEASNKLNQLWELFNRFKGIERITNSSGQ
jgi:hypothetical protein